MIYRRTAQPTLTAVEIQHGDTLAFTRQDGEMVPIEVLDTGAEIVETTLKETGVEESGAMTVYRFHADCRISGEEHRLVREVGSQASFYEPWEIAGVRIWLDAVDAIFTFMNETHAPCRLQENALPSALPERRHARLAVQDACLRICPEPLHPWIPLPEGGLRIEACYRGEDCWLGPYDGASAHGGLDINQPSGTPVYAPIALDDHFLYNAVADGHRNNRWRGVRYWPDHSLWILTLCHLNRLTVPAHTPLQPGQHYAEGAGTAVGCHEHHHFAFAVVQYGELIRLDPWILFWQMYHDQP